MKLDVIIPIYNEEGSIDRLYKELTKNLKEIHYRLLFIDDGSTDKTLTKLTAIYNKDKKHVRIISFSRNFGKESAMYAGLSTSNAEYTCIIDADMQQNPKYIIDMLNFIEKNPEYDEVTMVNNYSKEKRSSKFLKTSFYKILSKVSGQKNVVGASDFRLFKRYVVEALVNMKETNRFSKGLFSWVGFKVYYMPYDVEKRTTGESKFKLKKQISYATNGIINFSTKPLRIATILGSIISTISFIYLIQILFQTLFFGKDIPGYPSIMCVMLLLGGIQLLVLGIIGEYLSKAYIELKQRPIYVAKTKLGFDDEIL